jgi:hypothetical protein
MYALDVWFDKPTRNFVFQAILDAKGDPRAFELSQDEFDAQLRHLATGSTFSFKPVATKTRLHLWWTVGDGDMRGPRTATWDEVPSVLAEWIEAVEEYASLPDLWAQLGSASAAQLGSGDDENAPFTEDERSAILQQLDEIRHYARQTLDLTAEQTKQLEGKLLYLQEATERMGRKDWRTIAIGTMVTLVTEAVLPATEVQHILTMLIQPLAHLFGHALPQLPPSH